MVSQSHIARVQTIAAQHAIMELGSANSRALFSHAFFSQSALVITVLLKVTALFHRSSCLGIAVWLTVAVFKTRPTQEETEILEEERCGSRLSETC